MTTEPEWVKEWTKKRHPIAQDGRGWMRTRPASVKAVMRRFPPSCVVRDTCGCYGILASVFEDGTVSIRRSPDSKERYRCHNEHLTVVGYWNGMTPELVAEILDEH